MDGVREPPPSGHTEHETKGTKTLAKNDNKTARTNREKILARMRAAVKSYRKEVRQNRSKLAKELRKFANEVEKGYASALVIPSTAGIINRINRDGAAVAVLEDMMKWIENETND